MKFLDNESSITFKSLNGTHVVMGGTLQSISQLPDAINWASDVCVKNIPAGAEERHTFSLIKQIVTTPVFMFTINKSCTIVGTSRHGGKTNVLIGDSVGQLEITSKNAIFQLRYDPGDGLPIVSTADRSKLVPFYTRLPKDSPQRTASGYWAVAIAITEYGVKLENNIEEYKRHLSTARSKFNSMYDQTGGASLMGVDWAGSFDEPKGKDYILLDGRRIALPDGVKHTSQFEGMHVLEHKNGKVREASILCLLNHNKHDKNTLALVEHEIKMAQQFIAALEIFAEVLRSQGQTVEPPPLAAAEKKGKKSARKTTR